MNRRGMALLVAVIALAVMGGVAVTLQVLTLAESALGSSSMEMARAEAIAEGAAALAWRGWPASATPSVPGDSLELSRFAGAGGEGRAVLRALGGPLFALESTAPILPTSRQRPGRAGVLILVAIDSAAGDSVVMPHLVARGWRMIPR